MKKFALVLASLASFSASMASASTLPCLAPDTELVAVELVWSGSDENAEVIGLSFVVFDPSQPEDVYDVFVPVAAGAFHGNPPGGQGNPGGPNPHGGNPGGGNPPGGHGNPGGPNPHGGNPGGGNPPGGNPGGH